jgi:AsmA protein
VNKLDLSEVKINLLARGGLVSALPEAKLYGGSYTGDLQIQTRTKPVTLRSKQDVRKVAIGPIVKALYGKETLTGEVNFVGQFFSEGETQAAITSHLNGDGQFHVSNAELKSMDMRQLILGKWYDKVKFAQEKNPDKEVRVFDSMRGSIRIKSGVAYNKDFLAISRVADLRGDGYANLNTTQIDYTMNVVPKKSLAFSLGGHTYELKDKVIPTRVTGSWSDPKIDYGIDDVYKDEFKQTAVYKKTQAAEEKLQGKLQQEEDKLKDKKDKLKDKLNNLLKK